MDFQPPPNQRITAFSPNKSLPRREAYIWEVGQRGLILRKVNGLYVEQGWTNSFRSINGGKAMLAHEGRTQEPI